MIRDIPYWNITYSFFLLADFNYLLYINIYIVQVIICFVDGFKVFLSEMED